MKTNDDMNYEYQENYRMDYRIEVITSVFLLNKESTSCIFVHVLWLNQWVLGPINDTQCPEFILVKPWLKFNWLPSASQCHDDHDAKETWEKREKCGLLVFIPFGND